MELIGGKIIISSKGYSKELHQRLLKQCKENSNSENEMMFLVPPRLVTRVHNVNDYCNKVEARKFLLTDDFKEKGIEIWDGINTDLRTTYPVEINQHRLLQYDCCRGLEGWTVIYLELDEFVKYKLETFVESETTELALESFAEKRRKFVYGPSFLLLRQ